MPLRAPLRASLRLAPLALAAAPLGAQRPSRAAVRARVDSLAAAFLASGQAPGVAIAVVRGRDTLVLAGYGTADVERRVPVRPNTVFRVGSVAKQFTASLVLRLVERGVVTLDDPIGRHLAALPAAWRGVTIHQLLNHTSGIPSYTNAPSWQGQFAERLTPAQMVAITAGDTMEFAPGTRWSYNNTGYVLLGVLLERKLGRPYAELLQSELARPLALRATRYCADADTTAAIVAHGYFRDSAGVRRAPYLHMSQPFSAGALCSTAGDLARWNAALAGGRVVRPASYAAMTGPGAVGAGAPVRYGYGLIADTLAGRRVVTHGGTIFGFLSANAYLPDDSLSVTVLANASPSDPGTLLRDIARVALGVPLSAPARVP